MGLGHIRKLYKAPKDYTKKYNARLLLKSKSTSKKTMKLPIHKCVLNVKAGPNPTPMSKSDKY